MKVYVTLQITDDGKTSLDEVFLDKSLATKRKDIVQVEEDGLFCEIVEKEICKSLEDLVEKDDESL